MPKERHQLINQTSGDVELFTPKPIIEAARRTLGGIDLDPASTAQANRRLVKALKFYTKRDDGLKQPWTGRVWLNHPYGIAENACDPAITGRPCHKKICASRGHHRREDYPGNAGWINKLVRSYEAAKGRMEACCICFASTSEEWFQPLFRFPQCYFFKRVNYCDAHGQPIIGVPKGSVVTYLGRDLPRFAQAFHELGNIVVPYGQRKK